MLTAAVAVTYVFCVDVVCFPAEPDLISGEPATRGIDCRQEAERGFTADHAFRGFDDH